LSQSIEPDWKLAFRHYSASSATFCCVFPVAMAPVEFFDVKTFGLIESEFLAQHRADP
jgi:hypothetical protein